MIDRQIYRASVPLSSVPPWRYLRPGMTPELASLIAAEDMGMSHPVDILLLGWKLRRLKNQIAEVSAPTAHHGQL